MNNSILSYLHHFSQQLAPLYVSKEEQQHIAWLLVQKVTGKSLIMLLREQDYILTEEQKYHLERYLDEHVNKHKPLQYILGSVPFGDLEIIVESPTLIPRPETEEWVCNLSQKLCKLGDKKLTILDMCTGSGVIALSLAKALPQAALYAVDSEEHALLLAKKNADFNGITSVHFIQSDLFELVSKDITFDLIVTNPPYITQQEYNESDPMVKNWEDSKALLAQDEGLAIIKKIIKEAPSWLHQNDALHQQGLGNLYIEIGHLQGSYVQTLMREFGYENVHVLKDLTGHDRVAVGYYRP